jgi:two-component system, NtrC family, sensor kinase
MKAQVLVVDDSLTVRMDLGEALEAAGFRVVTSDALTSARAELSRQRFDLLILDLLLPDGDGLGFLEVIKRDPTAGGLPVMLLTSEAEVHHRLRGWAAGADDYVGKPYDTAYVVARARELTRGRRAERAAGKGTLLIVDDSATWRAALKRLLEAEGYDVVAAATGEDGLRVAASLRPLAMVVDGALPGIDGRTVVNRFRLDPALRRTPILLLTGSSEAGDELSALDAGADAYLRKGSDEAVILARLHALLRLADHLRGEGYDVAVANTPTACFSLLAVQPVDCVLLDLAVSGAAETCGELRTRPAWRDMVVLLLATQEDDAAVIAGINAGADDCVAVSGGLEVLKARLRAQFRRKQIEEENRTARELLLRKERDAAEARAVRELAEMRADLLADLQTKNEVLEGLNAELVASRDRAERESRFKTRFLSTMTHELRTPLNAVNGFSEILLEQTFGPLNERQAVSVQHILDSGRHLLEVVNTVLDIAKIEAGREDLHPEWGTVDAAFDNVHGMMRGVADKKGVRLGFHAAEHLPPLWADPLRLKQILVNLISNAVKFTSPGGSVEVRASVEGDHLRFEVEDTGVGIAAENLPRLFREFEQIATPGRHQEGTGLGLALTRRLVELHGGTITVESSVGVGTTFVVRLPLVPRVAAAEPEAHSSEPLEGT